MLSLFHFLLLKNLTEPEFTYHPEFDFGRFIFIVLISCFNFTSPRNFHLNYLVANDL
jgi:hypothetical protein